MQVTGSPLPHSLSPQSVVHEQSSSGQPWGPRGGDGGTAPLCLIPSELPSPPGDGDHQSDSHARPRWEAAFLQGREVSRREGSTAWSSLSQHSCAKLRGTSAQHQALQAARGPSPSRQHPGTTLSFIHGADQDQFIPGAFPAPCMEPPKSKELKLCPGQAKKNVNGIQGKQNDPEYSSAPAQAAALPQQCFSMRYSLLLQLRIAS